MSIHLNSIQHQQFDRLVQNNTLRKAAAPPEPPKLTDDESSMIQKKFTNPKPLNLYNVQGDVREQDFPSGMKVDTRV
ncbi:MAG: hypothetical protein WD355_08595 [Balneolaceae bacterium]